MTGHVERCSVLEHLERPLQNQRQRFIKGQASAAPSFHALYDSLSALHNGIGYRRYANRHQPSLNATVTKTLGRTPI
jgi:hypothetical protein